MFAVLWSQTRAEKMINLSPGPAPLPMAVVKAYANGLMNENIICTSHRSVRTQSFIAQLKSRIRVLLNLDDCYDVLFLSGSSRETSLRIFRHCESMHQNISHYVTGYWSEWASHQTRSADDPHFRHICLNETVNGIFIDKAHDLPTIADTTSCLFVHPLIQKAAIWYASGQKIFSMPGFSLMIVDQSVILPESDLYQYMTTHSSCVTPPLHGMLLLHHFLNWLESLGGVSALFKRTAQRANRLYACLEHQHMQLVDPMVRSITSLVFQGQSDTHTQALTRHMKQFGVIGFENHQAVPGMRIMNLPGLEDSAFETLLELVEAFQ